MPEQQRTTGNFTAGQIRDAMVGIPAEPNWTSIDGRRALAEHDAFHRSEDQ